MQRLFIVVIASNSKVNETYMANAKTLHWVPNATYISLTCIGSWVGGNANFRFGFGGKANFSVFRYQHVCIPNAKLWHWGSKPTPAGPNANGFASHWNIGFTLPEGITLKKDFLKILLISY